MILVDSGDFFFRDQFLADSEMALLKRKAQVLAQGAKLMGYDVVCPGEADLALGLARYQELVKTAGMQPVCANLKIGNDLVFPATAVRVVSGVRVGFIGALTVHRPLPGDGQRQLLVDSVEESARKAVEELKSKVDVIVALTHQGFDQDQNLARKVPGINVVIGGHSKETLGTGHVVEKTTIHQSGYQGKYLGSVKLRVKPGAPGASPVVERIASEAIPMDPSIKDEPQTAKLVADHHRWLTDEAKKNAPSPGSAAPRREESADVYWGATLCGQCHPKQDEWWRTTRHATAFDTLVKLKKQGELACLPCHTTGFLQTRARPENKGLTDVTGIESVQCEACHAPGSRHNTPEVRARASRKSTCTGCHDAKMSPKFDFEKYLARYRCPTTAGAPGQ